MLRLLLNELVLINLKFVYSIAYLLKSIFSYTWDFFYKFKPVYEVLQIFFMSGIVVDITVVLIKNINI